MQIDKATADELLNRGVEFHKKGKWDHVLECMEKAGKIYKELNDIQGISNTFNYTGEMYKYRGDLEHALEYYKKGYIIKKELNDEQGISILFNNIGDVYKDRGNWKTAIEYYKKSREIKEGLNDERGISISLKNFGDVFKCEGYWEKSLISYYKSLRISEKIDDNELKSYILTDIGEINIEEGNWEKAEKNLKESLGIAEELGLISRADILANLGELWRAREKYNEAIETLNEALKIVKHAGAKPKEIIILEKLGDTYKDIYNKNFKNKNIRLMETLSLAEKYYYQAHELAESLNMQLRVATTKRGIGIIQAKKKEITESKNSFIKSIEILRNLGAFFELQKTSLEYAMVLSDNYISLNDLIEAEFIVKSVIFDADRNRFKQLVINAYLTLGDITMKFDNQYNYYDYYIDSLEEAKFNVNIYIRTCFKILYRMEKGYIKKEILSEFIKSLQKTNEDQSTKDTSFNDALNILSAKIEGKDYDITILPNTLANAVNNVIKNL